MVVCERQGGHALTGGSLDEAGGGGKTAQEGVVGMGVEVGEQRKNGRMGGGRVEGWVRRGKKTIALESIIPYPPLGQKILSASSLRRSSALSSRLRSLPTFDLGSISRISM